MFRILISIFFFFSFSSANAFHFYLKTVSRESEGFILERDLSTEPGFLGRIQPCVTMGGDEIFTFRIIVQDPLVPTDPARAERLRIFNIDIFDAGADFRVNFYGVLPAAAGRVVYRIHGILREQDDVALFRAIEAYYKGDERGTDSAYTNLYAMLENHFRLLSEEEMRVEALRYQRVINQIVAGFANLIPIVLFSTGGPRFSFLHDREKGL